MIDWTAVALAALGVVVLAAALARFLPAWQGADRPRGDLDALLLAVGVIWGVPYLLIKVAVEDLPAPPPAQGLRDDFAVHQAGTGSASRDELAQAPTRLEVS